MPEDVQTYPPERLLRYPHMFPRDIAIWERFIDKYANEFNRFAYDIKVGSGAPAPSDFSENYQRMVRDLSRFRIDSVGYRNGRIEVLEVKPRASAAALGQVLTYVTLFIKEFAPSLPVVGGIVTDQEMPDIRELTTEYGMVYYIV